MGINVMQKNLKYLLIWVVLLAIIYFLKKIRKGNNNLNKVNENEVQVEERGIRVKYNNQDLKIKYCEYFFTLIKNGEITKEQFLNGLSKNEWIKLNNHMLIGLTDFTEEDMLIPWESIKSWRRFLGRGVNLPHLSVYIKNTDRPIKIDLGLMGIISSKVSYFKKMIPEKQQGIDPVTFSIILIILIPLLGLIFAMIMK